DVIPNDREKNQTLDNTSSTLQNTSKGFVVNHNINMISVEQAKSNERIEYSESNNEKGSGKNKIPKKKENWSKNGKIQINHLKKHLLQHKKPSKAHMRSAKPQDEPPDYSLPPTVPAPILPPTIPATIPPPTAPAPILPPTIPAPIPPPTIPATIPPPAIPDITTPIITEPPLTISPPIATSQAPIVPTITVPTNLTITTFETLPAPTIPIGTSPPVSIYTSPFINQSTITIPIATEIVTTNLPISQPPSQAVTTLYTITNVPATTIPMNPTIEVPETSVTEAFPISEETTLPSISIPTIQTPLTIVSATPPVTTLIPSTLSPFLPSIPSEPVVVTTPLPIPVPPKPVVPIIPPPPPTSVVKPPQLPNPPVIIPPTHEISKPIYIQGVNPIFGSGGIVPPPQANPIPPTTIDECPAEVESMGCFVFGKFQKRLFKTVITNLKAGQTFEELFCECGNQVEKRGWTVFALSNGKCLSGKNENGFDKSGISESCFNEDGEACSDSDTYCIGDKNAISVYGIIKEETRSFIVESSSKHN
ncbi:hypothetical protein MXB_5460, partial [Myxobolus squamalis]